MQPLYAFGRPGVGPGEFIAFHELTTDSKGTLYTADLAGRNAQKFVFKGIVSAPENPDGLPSVISNVNVH